MKVHRGKVQRLLSFVAVCSLLGGGLSAQAKDLVCGIALGFPPYQFTSEKGDPTGIDAEITQLVFKELGTPIRFNQAKWDDIYLNLAHNRGAVDMLCGAEISEERKALFDFSKPYYSRVVVIFVRADSNYKKLEDLNGKMITGDRGGYIETLINKNKLRIVDSPSKEVGFQKLKKGEVEAVISPLEVGNWLSKQLGLVVQTLPERDQGSPVAFAVAKGNSALATRISTALDKLQKAGAIDAVMKRYK